MWRRLAASIFAAILAVPLIAQAVAADPWAGFYSAKPRPAVSPDPAPTGCVAAILAAQREYQIPNNLLLAIGIQEAGRRVDGKLTVWPWAVNAEGTGHFFRTGQQAKGWVQSQLSQGVRSIDVGCMQINLRWHGGAFASLDEAFDPIINARYAAQFLTRLKAEEGTWWKAAGSYHSKTAEYRDRYLASLARNQNVANAQYERLAVASPLTSDRRSAASAPQLPRPVVLWGETADQDAAFSLYSRQPLTPVLPAFQVVVLSNE